MVAFFTQDTDATNVGRIRIVSPHIRISQIEIHLDRELTILRANLKDIDYRLQQLEAMIKERDSHDNEHHR